MREWKSGGRRNGEGGGGMVREEEGIGSGKLKRGEEVGVGGRRREEGGGESHRDVYPFKELQNIVYRTLK